VCGNFDFDVVFVVEWPWVWVLHFVVASDRLRRAENHIHNTISPSINKEESKGRLCTAIRGIHFALGRSVILLSNSELESSLQHPQYSPAGFVILILISGPETLRIIWDLFSDTLLRK
jgi:hypothetical protein